MRTMCLKGIFEREINFLEEFPQGQKRFYQILIRDMKILDLIENNLEPFLLEIILSSK